MELSCLWDPMDGSLLGFFIYGVFQARILATRLLFPIPADLPDSGINLPFPVPGDIPDSGINPVSVTLAG